MVRTEKIRDGSMLLVLLLLALIPRLALIFFKGFEIFHADHAVFGLMAKHILEGKPMIYYYGQGYMGSLDAWMAAFLFLIGGMNLFTLQMAPLMFYFLFLITNFYLLRRLFGVEVSVLANLLLAISPPALNIMCSTLGCYPETFFFGSLTLMGLIHYSPHPSLSPKGGEGGGEGAFLLFLTGLAAGLGFWTNNLILLYFAAVGILWFLKTRFWAELYPSLNWRRIFLLEGVRIPVFLRGMAVALHIGIAVYFLWNLLSFFTGEILSLGPWNIEMASPPFHVKKAKKILMLIAGESLVLVGFAQGLPKLMKNLKPILPLAGGFLAGCSPIWLYSLFGGEGYRMIHGSGMIWARDFPAQFQAVVWDGFVDGILGIPTASLFSGGGFRTFHAWTLLALVLGLLIYPALSYKKERVALLQLRPLAYPPPFFFYFLILIFLAVCLFSTLVAGRYLLPSYFAVSTLFALALSRLRKKIGAAAWFLFFFLIASYAYANYEFISKINPQEKARKAPTLILQLLESRGIQGGYAHFVTSYVLTFQAREKIIIAPFRSPDRYPAYARWVDGLPRVAYLFQDDDSYLASFQERLDENRISYEKVWIEPYWVFLIDRKEKSEKGLV